jgi:glycosyltransferase involved in cell wall biosynthesis
MSGSPRRIALFIRSFAGGGVERMTMRLAAALIERGEDVDVLALRDHGPNRRHVPEAARVFTISERSRMAGLWWAIRHDPRAGGLLVRPRLPELLRALPSYAAYLEEARPDVVVSAMAHCNLVAAAARRLLPNAPSTILTERNPFSVRVRLQPSHRRFARLMRALYPSADALVGISEGVSADLATFLELPHDRVSTIYNPVFHPDIIERSQSEPDHRWFDAGVRTLRPVIVSVGRLHPQKDYGTLIRALAILKSMRLEVGASLPRLVILGEGKERDALVTLATRLGVREDVDLPGYVNNPYAFMARASAFALTSRYEGFGNVTVEALACGCPVIAVDAPGGQAEILAGGRYGRLVPVGEPDAVARALFHTLADPPDSDVLRARATTFSAARSADALLELFTRSLRYNVPSPSPDRQDVAKSRSAGSD